MTRQRSRESLVQTMFTSCPYCSGSALIKTHESTVIEIERALKKAMQHLQQFGLRLIVHPDLDHYMEKTSDKEFLDKLAKKMKARLDFETSDILHLNDFHLYSTVTKEILEI
jgi:ribonuclease G